MNDRERQNSKKNRSGGGISIFAVLGFIILMNVIRAGGGEAIVGILAIALIIAVGIFGLKAGKKVIKKKTEDQAPVRRKAPETERRQTKSGTAERQVYNPTVYNENASAENFQRDRQRRIAQLDGFLKNGIIDKDEYQILLSRYEKT